MQKLARRWGWRLAIAAGILAAVNLTIAGASSVFSSVAPEAVSLPEVAAAPEPLLATLAVPAIPELQPEPPAVPTPQAPDAAAAPAARAGTFHVAVGLFSTEERAARLVAELSGAGLPAFHRPVKMSSERVLLQVLLGPYEARSGAQADLRRLNRLLGIDDAAVIEVGSTAADDSAASPR
jgi:cell division septation protein DedD